MHSAGSLEGSVDSTSSSSVSSHCSTTPQSSSSSTSTPEPQEMPSSGLARWRKALAGWHSDGSGWDLSGQRELSHLLKEATAQAHKDVLRPAIVNKLITGQIPLETHILYLMMLFDVYDALETGISQHSDHPLLASTYRPDILARTQAISDDISFLLETPPGQDWSTHPSALHYRSNPPEALTTYVARIKALSQQTQLVPEGGIDYVYPPPPAQAYLLLAHAYVRYMGDLNGGQVIKESVCKAYDLDDTGDGLRFYRFDNDAGLPASPAELSKLTSWYRRGIDAAGEQLDKDQRAAMLQEANHAFELNIRLFSSFSDEPDEAAEALLVPASLDNPRIPSPSLEGYAKAAAYMPGELLSPTVKKRSLSPTHTVHAQQAVSNTTLSFPPAGKLLQVAFALATLLPVVFFVLNLLPNVKSTA